ncbi:hypothetical protein NJ76_26780 [Rhodococcus sp. IITR03]|nr:hypothetical protein NJ76_26780 [Rhodococcus sp. IITR03]
MTSTGKISHDEKWELDMVLAYAECGIGTDAPIRWAEVKPSISALAAMMTTQQDAPSCVADLNDEQPDKEPLAEGRVVAEIQASDDEPASGPQSAACGGDESLQSPIDSLFDEGVVGEAEKQPVTSGDKTVDPDRTKIDTDGDLDERRENGSATEPDSTSPVETVEIIPSLEDNGTERDVDATPWPGRGDGDVTAGLVHRRPMTNHSRMIPL